MATKSIRGIAVTVCPTRLNPLVKEMLGLWVSAQAYIFSILGP